MLSTVSRNANDDGDFEKDIQLGMVNGNVNSITLTKKEQVSSIPRVIFKKEYGRLRDLNMSRNQIIELEARIFLSLPLLRVLNVSNNKLKYISGKIETCQDLDSLIVDKNEL